MTGGGTGIGAACCRALAAEGFRVGVHYRASERGAPRSWPTSSPTPFALRAELADPAPRSTRCVGASSKERAGRLDVLVNNAGAATRNAPMPTMKLEDYDAVAGARARHLVPDEARAAALHAAAGRGRIINISSVVGHTGNAGQIAVHDGEGRPRRAHEVARAGARRAARSSSTRSRRASSTPR